MHTPRTPLTPDELLAVALAIRELPAGVIDGDIGVHAIELAVHGWEVFPLRGKAPAIPNPHPRGSLERQACKGECGLQGHGVLDATTDLATVAAWWGGRYRGCNIGARVPPGMFVLDIDPRNGGLESLAALEQSHGRLPFSPQSSELDWWSRSSLRATGTAVAVERDLVSGTEGIASIPSAAATGAANTAATTATAAYISHIGQVPRQPESRDDQ